MTDSYGNNVSVTRRTSMTDLPGISSACSVSGAVPFSRLISPSFSGRNSFERLKAPVSNEKFRVGAHPEFRQAQSMVAVEVTRL